MPEPKPLTTFAETMVRTHYGRRTLQWIGDRLGCSPVTVLSYAEQLGLWKPTTDEKRGTATAPAGAIRPFIPPPTREQLMAGSANPRRVYKIED
jgi:hypothetical protein